MPSDRLYFDVPGLGEFSAAAPWGTGARSWAPARGRTAVMVIDDQIQTVADLSDETEMQRRICSPLNVEFLFCSECAPGHPLARDGEWFEAVGTRLREQRNRLAAVFLDVMFEGEWDPLQSSGIRFLARIHEVVPELPVLIMTQASDQPRLHAALARSGLHLSFLQKDTPDRVGALSRFLFEFGWLGDPAFGAYSPELRAEVSRLRRYAAVRPRLDSGLPQPLLFVADSGEGKTRSAGIAARWLLTVKPPLRARTAIETLDCNTLERGQGAQIALFGRGPRDRREQADPSGLAVRGKAQRAAGGTLIVDELGNSSHAFQELLLTFIETGRTQPEWIHDGMTEEALGPLDVLFEFTAQPRHIEEGRIKDDLARRYARGTTVMIPPLKDRIEDIAPVLFETVEAWWRTRRVPGAVALAADQLLLPEMEQWLVEAVSEHGLSASAVVDLVGHPENAPLGIPYFEHRLRQILAPRPGQRVRAVNVPEDLPQKPTPTDRPSAGVADALALLEQLAGNGAVAFPRDATFLRGELGSVTAAAARLVLTYLEACADIASGGREQANVAGTYNLIAGAPEAPRAGTTVARTRLKDLFLVSPEQTLAEIRRSEVLASLAIQVAKGARSQGLRALLAKLGEEPDQGPRLRRLGWPE